MLDFVNMLDFVKMVDFVMLLLGLMLTMTLQLHGLPIGDPITGNGIGGADRRILGDQDRG